MLGGEDSTTPRNLEGGGPGGGRGNGESRNAETGKTGEVGRGEHPHGIVQAPGGGDGAAAKGVPGTGDDGIRAPAVHGRGVSPVPLIRCGGDGGPCRGCSIRRAVRRGAAGRACVGGPPPWPPLLAACPCGAARPRGAAVAAGRACGPAPVRGRRCAPAAGRPAPACGRPASGRLRGQVRPPAGVLCAAAPLPAGPPSAGLWCRVGGPVPPGPPPRGGVAVRRAAGRGIPPPAGGGDERDPP